MVAVSFINRKAEVVHAKTMDIITVSMTRKTSATSESRDNFHSWPITPV